MEYPSFDPNRYAPDLPTARRRGEAALLSINQWLGGRKDQAILEVGCGCGCLMLALREQGYTNCQGIDGDEALVRHGREVLGTDLAMGHWRSFLEESEATYDVIIALDVLEHLPREELLPTLKISGKRLAPGGRLILQTPNALCPFALPTLYGDLTHQFLMAPRTLEYLLRLAGFAGPITIHETRPAGALKRGLFRLVHRLLVKPVVGLAYYHFHGEFPSHLTPNIICCAYGQGNRK
jgi:SAM-dependent methyltransferase